ncbi:MAG: chorismate synthase [Elusimicrobia bacterium]|nr:chorismate synthase [Elusimicrobiota bacterium]
MIRFLTSGESHGQALMAILEGIPAGLELKAEDINIELSRRQVGYGRGQRMQIEKDQVKIYSGVRDQYTIAAPIGLLIENRDWENWKDKKIPPVTAPRPGHADLAGTLKYDFSDIRNVLERASARETAARVAVGAVCRKLLREFNISIFSRTIQIGKIKDSSRWDLSAKEWAIIENSPVRCLAKKEEGGMIKLIDQAKQAGDTLGGIVEIAAINVPVGLGSYIQWDIKLDGRLAQALMSIQAIKAVEIGLGTHVAELPGSQVHDEISLVKGKGFARRTNNAGGIEGGISNGETIILRASMKPIATLIKPLQSIDLKTGKAAKATVERSDVCAVPAAGVIAENVVAFELVRAMQEKLGGDSLREMKRNYQGYMEQIRRK